jgi:hypothetical protein
MPSGFDPVGGTRFSEKIMRNIERRQVVEIDLVTGSACEVRLRSGRGAGKGELGHDLLKRAGLAAQVLDLVRCRRPGPNLAERSQKTQSFQR